MVNHQLVIWGPKKVGIIESPVPEPGAEEVLVKIKASAICTWEQRAYSGSQQDSYPLLGGHEFSGEVVSVGPGVKNKDITAGKTVAEARLTRCGECHNCRTGKDNLCLNTRFDRVEGKPFGPGGLSEYVVAPSYQIYPFSNNVSFEEAALSEPLSCVVRSIRRANVSFGQNVLVIGAGIMGLLHGLLAKHRGATVIISEPLEHRRSKAREIGVDTVINPKEENVVERVRELTGGLGADVVFVTAGGAAAIEEALRLVASGGTVVLYGAMYPPPMVTVDVNKIHHNEITITGTMSQTREDFLIATKLIDSGAIDLKPLISATIPFSQVEEAFERALDPTNYRIVVTMP